MSNNETNNNDIVIKFELPQIVNEALVPLASSIGTTLSTAWKGFTIGIDTWYGRKKIEQEHNLNLYAEEIQKQLSSIPEENIQEPKMNILGPSLEASKYYFEEEWYRKMFAKLIAGSCDNRNNVKIHPFFVEAIKQMTSLEARILSSFKKELAQPIVNYRFKLKNQLGGVTFIPYVFFLTDEKIDPRKHSQSIVNLERLGFIDISFGSFLSDENKYKIFEQNPTFVSMQRLLKSSGFYPRYSSLDIEKGMLTLTPLGQSFLDICI